MNLPDFLLVKNSYTYGVSIFAKKRIPQNAKICITSPNNLDKDLGHIVSPLGNVFNHSSFPNAKIEYNQSGLIEVISITEIKPGEEILVDYDYSNHYIPNYYYL